MTVQTLKIGREPYVVVREKEFRKMMDRLASYDAEERSDAAIVRKRLKSKSKLIPFARAKEQLGL